jgi:hypothetical protein
MLASKVVSLLNTLAQFWDVLDMLGKHEVMRVRNARSAEPGGRALASNGEATAQAGRIYEGP